ncbi:MAG: sodium/solute symporter [Cyclobacteriaceae bacterium]
MKNKFWVFLYSVAFISQVSCNTDHKEIPEIQFNWQELPEMPPSSGHTAQKGLAGPFTGIHNGALIIAGGANFPESLPWEGGEKVFWDQIYILEKTDKGKYKWRVEKDLNLPKPMAYGVSISIPEGILCIGGNDADRSYQDVFLMQWDNQNKKVKFLQFPSLPRTLTAMSGAMVDSKIFLTGGQESMLNPISTRNFWELDLKNRQDPGTFHWKELEPWPGPPRIYPITVAQSNGLDNCLYLLSGRDIGPEKTTNVLKDAYSYNPKSEQWIYLGSVLTEPGNPRSVQAGTAVPSGANHILVFGGDGGELFLRLESLEDSLNIKRDLLENHPGFSKEILAYNTITNTWTKLSDSLKISQVTTNALIWDGEIVIPTGEIRPGVRTPKILVTQNIKQKGGFGWINYSVLGLYLLCLVGMGFYFSKKETTTDEYFKAGGRIPWWAAGISIFGTQLSAITFMAIPAKTYATNWGYFTLNMTIILVAPVIVYLFLPFFRRLHITTAYEYLEKRFNLAVRLLGSFMFILLQFGRIGIVLFLPSLALSVVTGIDVVYCILIMGILSTVYTVLGGIEAVIWTDVVQVIILLFGAVLCLFLIAFQTEDGIGKIVNLAIENNKFQIFDFTFDLSTPTFWVVLFGGLGTNIISYGSDQTTIQRYLTTKDERSAARGIWGSALLTIPATLIFFSIGTLLYAFFRENPQLMDFTLSNTDAIFPFYIVSQLPQGMAGLMIAAIFAAAMSSLDSSMNSIASVVTTDFYKRFSPLAGEQSFMNMARLTTVIVGLAGTGFALIMAGWDIKSLWDQLNTFIGLFAGGLGGLFLLGICSTRANGYGAVIGLLASGVIQFLVKDFSTLSFLLYAFTGIVACFSIGYIASLLVFPKKEKSIEGLTLYNVTHR